LQYRLIVVVELQTRSYSVTVTLAGMHCSENPLTGYFHCSQTKFNELHCCAGSAGISKPIEQISRRKRVSDIKKQFEKAIKDVTKAKTEPSNELKLRLYAHFKQGTEGDVVGDKPGFTDIRGRAKYDAWAKIKGMDKDDAMKAYVKLVERVLGED
jgi:diazepam-binding inhibitor (GABA receptor modulator, acyl-CoA-binding protein)